MSELEQDVDRMPYLIYGATTFSYWSITTIIGYYAWSASFASVKEYWPALFRISYYWAFDGFFQVFMAPISIWWLISLFWPEMFRYIYSFWNGWSIFGIYGFNLVGLFWNDIYATIRPMDYAE